MPAPEWRDKPIVQSEIGDHNQASHFFLYLMNPLMHKKKPLNKVQRLSIYGVPSGI